MTKMKVLVAEKVSEEGLKVLKNELEVVDGLKMTREELLEAIPEFDALLVRSATQVDKELLEKATKLQIVGRAGNGIDNIDLDEATKAGVVVANTPDSNTTSAAELAIALLLASARNIPAADRQLKSGEWDRTLFKGTELFGKTVGIIGLGRIGSMVATRLAAFQMNVISYDPYISDERFRKFKVEKIENLDDLLQRADFITVHTPRTEETKGMLADPQFELMKDGVRLINDARGGIISEASLLKYLKLGKVRSAALDVHESEPSGNHELMEYPGVVVTPHIGADTDEAQENVGVTIANQVISALKGEVVANAVNLPTLNRENLVAMKPYIAAMEKLGKMYYQLKTAPIKNITINYYGGIAEQEVEMITLATIKGILEPVSKDMVNYVNAKLFAEQKGITVNEKKFDEIYNGFADLIRVEIQSDKETFTYAGNVNSKGEAKLVEVEGYDIDITPSEYMLFIKNFDVPGVIGKLGTILGTEKVNIATMQVGRNVIDQKALMVLGIDNQCSKEALGLIGRMENIEMAKVVKM